VIFRAGPRATYMVLAGDLVPAGTTLVTPAVESSEPFTITRAPLNRHIILSVDCIWLKQGSPNQLGSHLSASLSGPADSEKFFEEF